MLKKELPNPHLTIWKALLAGLYLNAMFAFFSRLFKFLWEPGRYVGWNSNPPTFPPLTIGDILLGSGFWPLSLWSLWAWQPRRKHAHWHRWLASLIGIVYLSVLVLLGGTASWNTLLNRPWNWVANSVLVALLFLAWILPAIYYPAAKKLTQMQWTLSGRMLGCVGIAGILGASFGIYASRKGEGGTVILIMAFAWPLVAVFLAQYNAERLWRYRPWQQEEE